MTKPPIHESHAENTAPISAHMREVEQPAREPVESAAQTSQTQQAPATATATVCLESLIPNWDLPPIVHGPISVIHSLSWRPIAHPEAAPASPAQQDALDAAELEEVQRAISDFEDCGETHVSYDLLMRAANLGYLECTKFDTTNDGQKKLDAARAAPAQAQQDAPAAAWMTPDGDRVVTGATMAGARKDGGAMLSSLRPYTVALVRSGARQDAPAAVALEQAAEAVFEADKRMWLSGPSYADLHDADKDRCRAMARAVLAAAPDAEEVSWLLKKYRKLCAEIGRGDSSHLERIDTAIAALAAAPAAPASQDAHDAPYSIDADPKGIRARVADAITGALALGAKKSGAPPEGHWLTPFWMQARFEAAQLDAFRKVTDALLDAQGAPLTQAAHDVLAERARQVDAEGFSHGRDDKYVGLQLAGAAASYLILAAGGPEEDARAIWPWRQEWLKPDSQRRYLEKAGALALAEIERLDRAALAAQQAGGANHG